MFRIYKNFAWTIIVITSLFLPAQNVFGKSDILNAADLRTLPKFCAVRINKGPPAELKRWQRILGVKNFNHLHHFCFGLKFSRAARSMTNKKEKLFTLGRAERNFEYVITHWPKTVKLYPEACGRLGQVKESLGKVSEAAQLYRNALIANPRFLAAYVALSDLYKKSSQVEEARNILKQGLAVAPKATVLKQRLASLK